MKRPLSGPVGQSTYAPDPRSTPATLSARVDRLPTGRFHFRIAGVVGTGTFFDGFDAISLAVVLPLVVRTFDISFATAGAIISAGYAGQFLGALFIGALSDRTGRKNAFLLCLVIFGGLAIPLAFAPSEQALMVLRFLQGLGLGAAVPIAATLVNEFLGRHDRGRFSVAYQTFFPLGLFFAPLVALVLSTTMPPEDAWRTLMGVGALPLVLALVAWRVLPESPRWLAARGRTDEAEALVQKMEADATRGGNALPAVEAQPAAAATGRPRLGEIFRGPYARRTGLLSVLWFTTFFVTYGFSIWLPTLYVSVGGLPPTRSLLLTVALGAVQVAMAVVVASVVEKMARRTVFRVGYAIAAAGALFGFINITLLHQTAWPVLFAVGVLMTIGIMLPTMTLYLYTNELYPTRIRGFATSSTSSLSRVASILSPVIFGVLLDGQGGAGLVFAVLAAAALIGLVTMLIGGVETRGKSLEQLSA